MIRIATGRKRLLRRKLYRSPHKRQKLSTYFRENNQYNKSFQDEFKSSEVIHKKRRPKREAISGFKMSYRYKYYNNDIIEEDEEEL